MSNYRGFFFFLVFWITRKLDLVYPSDQIIYKQICSLGNIGEIYITNVNIIMKQMSRNLKITSLMNHFFFHLCPEIHFEYQISVKPKCSLSGRALLINETSRPAAVFCLLQNTCQMRVNHGLQPVIRSSRMRPLTIQLVNDEHISRVLTNDLDFFISFWV